MTELRKTKEKIGKIIIGYQSNCRFIDKHYPEGMETQERFNAFEKTRTKHLDQILNLLKEELEKLTVIGGEEIREIEKKWFDALYKDKDEPERLIAQSQLSHTKEQLRELLE